MRRSGLLNGGYTETKRRRYPKLSLVTDCASHLILGVLPSRGPTPDFNLFEPALATVPKSVKIDCILADAGYDSESNHCHAREKLRIRTIIPPRYHKTRKGPKSRYRKLMTKMFARQRKDYRQRWQVETVMSMLKRCFGAALSARKQHMQNSELYLKALLFNLSIIAIQ